MPALLLSIFQSGAVHHKSINSSLRPHLASATGGEGGRGSARAIAKGEATALPGHGTARAAPLPEVNANVAETARRYNSV